MIIISKTLLYRDLTANRYHRKYEFKAFADDDYNGVTDYMNQIPQGCDKTECKIEKI